VHKIPLAGCIVSIDEVENTLKVAFIIPQKGGLRKRNGYVLEMRPGNVGLYLA
jgi:hypothetical protein